VAASFTLPAARRVRITVTPDTCHSTRCARVKVVRARAGLSRIVVPARVRRGHFSVSVVVLP
jgi:hypothetical protein